MTGDGGRNMSKDDVFSMTIPQAMFFVSDFRGAAGRVKRDGLSSKTAADDFYRSSPENAQKYREMIEAAKRKARERLPK